MAIRQIKPGENITSLWDQVTDERSEFRLFDITGKAISFRSDAEVAESLYMFYNDVNVAEDAILFPDELLTNKKKVPFRKIRNGVSSIEDGVLPSTARHVAKGLEAINRGKDPTKAIRAAKDHEEDLIWGLPEVWRTGLVQAKRERPSSERRALLERTGLVNAHKSLTFDRRMDIADTMEMMERDRSFSFKESFHDGDLEPGYNKKYKLVQERLHAMLRTPHAGSTDWVWFLAEILDWLELRGDYDDYIQDPQTPWPHSFIVRDLVEAFAMTAMFFPESGKAKLFREKEFWKEWKDFYEKKTDTYWADVYPLEWSMTVRPIIAHLYQAGVIAPAYIQNHPQVVLGMATASKEPHRPDERDLFVNYEDQYGNFPMKFPPFFVHPSKWPQIIPTAEKFAAKHRNARFALLRLWSAPHYYPLMVGPFNRQNTSFLDSLGRSWEWKFVPKDMPGSDYSAHHTAGKRLEELRSVLGDRVVNRGDLVLVMGEDANDLLKYCTAVVFAIQTKPWLREVDLWKSFINVNIEFLRELDSH
ncbi:hypothetical protein NW762_014000 [Fusarium torreyae]|uniref:Uncharacterized protein n=1 Tax=Fusarium torreyae TaxID=1237075 RepID=A0A9W8RNK0_9HYPO|nr:hypothetical protein NW762_014000 [Fusarium torreyae]